MEETRYLKSVEKAHFPVEAFSHKGFVRSNNEDSFAVKAFRTNEPESKDILLGLVADGVGGHNAGEIASRICVETISAQFASSPDLKDPAAQLVQAFVAANQEIVRQAQTHEEWNGMGTTCVCALIINDRLHVANIGDSRLYLIRDHQIYLLTYDHTWLEELSKLDIPEIRKINRNHPLAHVLIRYLGTTEPIQVDLRMRTDLMPDMEGSPDQTGLPLQAGDIILLTSDGVSDLLSDEEIKASLSGRRWERAVRRLIYNALKNGGHDNATAIAIRITKAN